MELYILDSTVFLEGYAQEFLDKPCATVYEVISEIKTEKSKVQLDMAIKTGLSLKEPSGASINKVCEVRDKTKDKVSDTDVKLLALALDLKQKADVVLVTDDYGVQNIAKILNIEYLAVSTEGIKKVFNWERICTGCGKKPNNEICEICGSKTMFKPKR